MMFAKLDIKLLQLKIKYRRKLAQAKEELSMEWNNVVADILDLDCFWTYCIDDDEFRDAEYETAKKAEAAADDEWGEYCEENQYDRDSDTRDAPVDLIFFFWDEKTGERRVIERREIDVTWEYYQGDYAEHRIY